MNKIDMPLGYFQNILNLIEESLEKNMFPTIEKQREFSNILESGTKIIADYKNGINREIKDCYQYEDGEPLEKSLEGAYWERDMLLLMFAKFVGGGWFSRPDLPEGFSRIVSLSSGKMCFTVPDSFDLHNLKHIADNYDGHNVNQKWAYCLNKIKNGRTNR